MGGSSNLLKRVFKQRLSGDGDLHMAGESIRLGEKKTDRSIRDAEGYVEE